LAEKKDEFERGMKRLEEIVTKLESGELPLDESITLFEEGMKLSKGLDKRLGEAERRVEIIVGRDASGGIKTEPFGDE